LIPAQQRLKQKKKNKNGVRNETMAFQESGIYSVHERKIR
jgi:hypothetical protein